MKAKTKTKTISKEWFGPSKGFPKIIYKKDSADWIYKYLGWKKNGRRTS